MLTIVLDEVQARKLTEAAGEVEFRDPAGKVLGKYRPIIDMSGCELLGVEISEEELERRANSTEWYTTEEVLAMLKKRENT